MAAQLSPCPACLRHVRVSERACPFCASPLEIVGYSSHTSHLREQAAAVFVGVTLAIAGCNTRTEQSNSNTTTDVKPVFPEVKAPETKPAAVLAPNSMATPPPIEMNVPAAPAYGLAPPPPPVYVAPPTIKRPAMKYGAPPPPFKPMKP